MEEIWRDIKDYEGYYQVSNMGRVKSLDRYTKGCYGSLCLHYGRILATPAAGKGYLFVGLRKNGNVKQRYVHRLVAQVFLPNPKDLPQVNHKDENKKNNVVYNLEWCTAKYNMNYGSVRKKIGAKNSVRKSFRTIQQVDMNGVVVAQYSCAAEAERLTGINSSAIRKVCLHKPKFNTAGGFKWIEINSVPYNEKEKQEAVQLKLF